MPSAEPDLYLVRIWRGAGRFRASVRRVDEEAPHCANSMAELVAYLCRDTPSGPDTALPPQCRADHPPAMTRDDKP